MNLEGENSISYLMIFQVIKLPVSPVWPPIFFKTVFSKLQENSDKIQN